MKWKVTTANRSAAKRLLNTWHDSRQVRTWTLAVLESRLKLAVADGMITDESIARALNEVTRCPASGNDAATRDNDTSPDAPNGATGNNDTSRNDSDATPAPISEQDLLDAARNVGAEDYDNGSEFNGEFSEIDAHQQAYADGYNAAEQADLDAKAGDDNNDNNDDNNNDDDDNDDNDDDNAARDDDNDNDDAANDNDADDDDNDDVSDWYRKGYDDAANGRARSEQTARMETDDERRAEYEHGYNDAMDNNADDDDDDSARDDETPLYHPMFDVVRKYIAAGLNVALVGPAGTGKSFLARQVAESLKLDFYVNGALMSKYDLIGYCDANGEYHGTPAYNAFTKGGVHCFDELDASAPEAVVAFNGMTDDQPVYTFPCGQREQHANYIAIACMNTHGQGASADYVGRFKQDAAAMDRFVQVYIDYDARIETKICGEHVDVLQRIRDLRAACELLGIRKVVSYRTFKKAALARMQKVTRAEIDRDILFSGLDDGAVKQIKAQMATIRRERNARERGAV